MGKKIVFLSQLNILVNYNFCLGIYVKQTLSQASKHTLLVNEYIHRYGDFDGFFTKSNVTLLTEATDLQ